MKKLFDRIAVSFAGILTLILIEGLVTFGSAFKFESYTWMGYTSQFMLVYITIWMSIRMYENK